MKISNLKVVNLAAMTASFLSVSSVLTNSPVLAVSFTEARETFVGTTALASSSMTLHALNVLEFVPDNTSFDLSSSVTDLGFVSTLTGIVGNVPFLLTESGSLTGNLGEDLILSIQSTGNLGNKAITKSAGARFIWDPISQEYSDYEYDEQGHINPFWGIIVKAARVASVWIFGAVTLDNPEPNPPVRIKTTPGTSITFTPTAGTCYVFVPDPVSSQSCTVRPPVEPPQDDTTDISAELVTAVPEPLTILGSVTAAGFGAFFKRKRKLSEFSEKDKIKAS